MTIISFKQFLNESFQGERFSLYILKSILNNITIEAKIESLFPVEDHNDIQTLKRISGICEGITKIPLSDNFLKEDFPAHEDLPLTILNKFFTGSNRDDMRKFLNLYNDSSKITPSTISDLYAKFHSSFVSDNKEV